MDRKRVLCFGDSNTWGYIAEGPQGDFVLRHPWGVRWPSVVADELGDEYEVLEEGCNGRTTGFPDPRCEGRNGLEYLKENGPALLPLDVAVVALGINDTKAAICGDVEASARALDSILDWLIEAGTGDILLILPAKLTAAVKGPPFAEDFGDDNTIERAGALRVAYGNLAAARGIAVLDAAEVGCAGRDGLHLTADSHVRLGKAVAQLIAAWNKEGAL